MKRSRSLRSERVEKAAEAASARPRLELRDVSFSYGERERKLLRGISASLVGGRLFCLLGANGAGKSTLFKLILGLLSPSSGGIFLDGRALTDYTERERARKMAYIPQEEGSLFMFKTEDVILTGAYPHLGAWEHPSSDDRRRVFDLMEKMDILNLAARPYPLLSGGERQLVRIARALYQDANILIMDEPSTGLDYGYQMRVLERARSLADEGYLVLFSAHNPMHAEWFADEIYLLRDGHLEEPTGEGSSFSAELLSEVYRYPLVRRCVEGEECRSLLLPECRPRQRRCGEARAERREREEQGGR